MAFDEIAKLSLDYCLMATVYQISKYENQINLSSDEIAELLDRETVLTRLMLKCMIERLTGQPNTHLQF